MGIEAALITAAVAATASTGYSIYSGERAAKKADEARADTERRAREAQTKIEEAEANKVKAAGFAQRRAAMRAKGAGGRSDTILTGPQGLGSDSSSGASSTLLGG